MSLNVGCNNILFDLNDENNSKSLAGMSKRATSP